MRARHFGSALGAVAALVALVICGLVTPRSAWAEWPFQGRAVCTAENGQTHSASATDGAGGAILVWQDARSTKVNLFAHHVLASGELDPAWPVNGRAVLANLIAVVAGGPFAPLIVSDGAGGAIVVWLDLRDSQNAFDVYAQHVLASGVVDPDWNVDGTVLCAIAGTQESPVMVSDGEGGAIVAWMDGRPGASDRDIYAQHILASGVVDPGWPENGLAVSTAPGLQEFPAITSDGAGGAIIAWDDARSATTGQDIYAQHVLGSGVLDRAWPVDGLPLCTALGAQGRPTISRDASNGAIVAWSDSRVVGTSHIFAQRALASGVVDPAWPTNGRSISNAGFLESRPLAVSDGAGGAIVTWQALDVHLNLYAQHIQITGVVDPRWPPAGRALSITPRQQSHAEIAADGIGGAVIAWEDSFDVVAQHVLASGALDPAYPDTGRVLVGLPSQQGDVSVVATGDTGAIVAWTDTRGLGADIFALQVLAAATVDVMDATPSRIAFEPPAPNPAHGPLTLRFALSRAARIRLDLYDVGGRRVRELAAGGRAAGEYGVPWDLRDERGVAVRGGVYFARLEVEGRSVTQKVVTVE
jgi:hypothetical protein